jgi:hypothetical protein
MVHRDRSPPSLACFSGDPEAPTNHAPHRGHGAGTQNATARSVAKRSTAKASNRSHKAGNASPLASHSFG